jgi:hypothetical protein
MQRTGRWTGRGDRLDSHGQLVLFPFLPPIAMDDGWSEAEGKKTSDPEGRSVWTLELAGVQGVVEQPNQLAFFAPSSRTTTSPSSRANASTSPGLASSHAYSTTTSV